MKLTSLNAVRPTDEYVSMVTPRRRRSATVLKRALAKTPNLALIASPVKRKQARTDHLQSGEPASTGSDSDDVAAKQVLAANTPTMDISNEEHKKRLAKLHVSCAPHSP